MTLIGSPLGSSPGSVVALAAPPHAAAAAPTAAHSASIRRPERRCRIERGSPVVDIIFPQLRYRGRAGCAPTIDSNAQHIGCSLPEASDSACQNRDAVPSGRVDPLTQIGER